MRAYIARVIDFFRAKGISLFAESPQNRVTRADVLLIQSDGDCGYLYKGKAYCNFLDSIADLLLGKAITTITVVNPYSKLYGPRSYSDALVFNRRFTLVLGLSFIFRLILGVERKNKFLMAQNEKVWSKILSKIQPKMIFSIQPDISLCSAAKKRNIQIFDVQHGVIGSFHPAYNMQRASMLTDNQLPSGILCWDRESADSIKNWTEERRVQVYIIGHLWVDRFLNPRNNDSLVLEAIAHKDAFTESRPTVLVTLQWVHNQRAEGYFDHVICPELREVIKITSGSYNWMLRLHPVQLTNGERERLFPLLEETFGGRKGVEWEQSTLLPLPIVLSRVQAHITNASTVVIEAAWFGVPSALLSSDFELGGKHPEMFRRERNIGAAVLMEKKSSLIIDWLVNATSKGDRTFHRKEEKISVIDLIKNL